jgi:hypothetical protein
LQFLKSHRETTFSLSSLKITVVHFISISIPTSTLKNLMQRGERREFVDDEFRSRNIYFTAFVYKKKLLYILVVTCKCADSFIFFCAALSFLIYIYFFIDEWCLHCSHIFIVDCAISVGINAGIQLSFTKWTKHIIKWKDFISIIKTWKTEKISSDKKILYMGNYTKYLVSGGCNCDFVIFLNLIFFVYL